MKQIIFIIYLLIHFNTYGQNGDFSGFYYRNTALTSLDFEIELEADSTYEYYRTTSWGCESDNGTWTIKNDIVILISNDTTKAIKKYICVNEIMSKRKIRFAKRKGYWNYLVKSEILYDDNGQRKKIVPTFDHTPYLMLYEKTPTGNKN